MIRAFLWDIKQIVTLLACQIQSELHLTLLFGEHFLDLQHPSVMFTNSYNLIGLLVQHA